jgi:hypothetical protein
MASTYSALKIELIGTGEQAGTWGNTTNTNLGTALEQAIVGKADVAMSSTTITLTLTNSNAAQDARAIYLNLTGSPGGAAVLEVPAIEKPYIVKNGADEQVTVKVSGQTGVAVPVGKTMWLYNNGTDVTNAIDNLPSGATVGGVAIGTGAGTVTSVSGTGTVQGLSLSGTVTSSGNLTLGGSLSAVNLTSQVTGTLPIANGGTGSTSTTYCSLTTNVTGTLPIANGGTGVSTAATNGQLLIGNGTNFTLAAITGTANRVTVTNGAGSITLTSPQDIATTSSVQFGSLGVGTAASGTTGEIRATNNVTAFFSDRRLKTDIEVISNALEKVNQISGITFKSNEVAAKYGYVNTKTQVGVIAQEIEEVLPQIVVPAPFDIGQKVDGTEYSLSGQNYKTVQYEKIVPLLIQAIKELKAEVDLLKNKG